MAKKIIAIVMAAVSLSLLAVIIISAATGWRISESGPAASDVQKPTAAEPKDEETRDVTEQVETELDTETPTDEITEEPTEPPTEAQTEEQTEAPTEKPTKAPSEEVRTPSADDMSTSTVASLKDVASFNWRKGWTQLSDSAKRLNDLSLLRGGWKACMYIDPQNKRSSYGEELMNIAVAGSEASTTVVFTWHKASSYEPMTFDGTFSDGKITAIGSGKVEITDFWYDNGKEYAAGKFTWPDGVVGYIGMVRP